MAKTFELPIKCEYLSNWTIEDGIRELIQNAMDAKTEYGGEMMVDYVKDTQTLRICNQNCVLPLEALLIGHTTKEGRDDMRGKYGEGFKFGINVLERNNCPVKIRTGGEVWTFEIKKSKLGFNANVLFCNISDGRKPEKRVRIEVKNITEEQWETIKGRFLFLQKYEQIVSEWGSVLLDEHLKGKVFVKGIFVEKDEEELEYGYDLLDATVDRDRKMAETYSKFINIAKIWAYSVRDNQENIGMAYNLLANTKKTDLRSGCNVYWGEENYDAFVTIFKAQNGADAFPVNCSYQKNELGHLGVYGVVLPDSLATILQRKMGVFNQFFEKLKNEVKEIFAHENLAENELTNLQWASDIVTQIERIKREDIDIVNYRSENIEGMFTSLSIDYIDGVYKRDGKVSIAKRILSDKFDTLRILVHEVAHRYGGDGEKAHVAKIEEIWKKVTKILLNEAEPKRVISEKPVMVKSEKKKNYFLDDFEWKIVQNYIPEYKGIISGIFTS